LKKWLRILIPRGAQADRRSDVEGVGEGPGVARRRGRADVSPDDLTAGELRDFDIYRWAASMERAFGINPGSLWQLMHPESEIPKVG
jgi:hypothetical protein